MHEHLLKTEELNDLIVALRGEGKILLLYFTALL